MERHHIINITGWSISILLLFVIVALVFVHSSPDYNIYIVQGQSMKPSVNRGDMVITAPPGGLFSGEVKPGTIVTYQRGSAPVTHRVISVDGNTLITKGDAAEDPDSKPLSINDVTGILVLRIPYVGYLSNFMGTMAGWMTLVLAPTLLFACLLVRRIVQEAKGIT